MVPDPADPGGVIELQPRCQRGAGRPLTGRGAQAPSGGVAKCRLGGVSASKLPPRLRNQAKRGRRGVIGGS